MTGQTCSCGEAVHAGTYLCRQCVRTLDVALANIAVHDSDLETLRSKLTRYGSSGTTKGGLGKSQPLVLDLRFAPLTNARVHDEWQVPGKEGQGTQLHHDVRNTLTTWARVCLDTWPVTTPADHVPGLCAFLQGILTAVAGQPWAGELLADMLRLEQALTRFVDRPPERLYLGACTAVIEGQPCSGAVYARDGERRGLCTQLDCAASYDTATSRTSLEEALDSRLCTASEIARLATYLGLDASRDQIRKRINQWHARGRIVAQSHTAQGDPAFRYGSVRGMLYADFGQEAS